jgi:WhiB family redox-sensing transcriptional regulator
MTERERRALLRRRPSVDSWRRMLETARTEYERGAGLLPLDPVEEEEELAFKAFYRREFAPLEPLTK